MIENLLPWFGAAAIGYMAYLTWRDNVRFKKESDRRIKEFDSLCKKLDRRTRRDDLAKRAMAGLLASEGWNAVDGASVASRSYSIADAMLAESEKPEANP